MVRLPLLLVAALASAGCAGTPAAREESASEGGGLALVPGWPRDLDPSSLWIREPMVAAGLEDPMHLVVAMQDRDASGRSWDIALVTRDGGATWSRAEIPGGLGAGPAHPLASAAKLSDPVAAILRDGTVLYAGLASNAGEAAGPAFAAQGVTLFVARSEDGGLTYPEIQTFGTRPGATSFVFFPVFLYGTALQDDKPWLATGPQDEALLVWSDQRAVATAGALLWSASLDQGRSWSAPSEIEAADGLYWGASPAIAPDGSWHVLYVAGGLEGAEYRYDLRLASSRDRGADWEARTLARDVPFHMPQLAIDPATGAYAAAYETMEEDASMPVIVFSADGGGSWSAPAPLAQAPMAFPGPQLALAAGNGRIFASLWDGDARTLVALRDGAEEARVVLGAGAASGDYAGLVVAEEIFSVWTAEVDGRPRVFGAQTR